MTYWNLLVVLCFVVLYLGIALVFLQLRRLRDEMKNRNDRSNPIDTEAAFRDFSNQMTRQMANLEAILGKQTRTLGLELKEEIESIQGEMRFLGRSNPVSSHSGAENSEGNSKEDAYREARLLLSNGVDEERVITETGLTVEEVSLLKRITNKSQDDLLD